MNPKVSIITTVFNASAYLSRCFDSLLSMSLCEYEVIVVDDGSSDNSWDIIKRYTRQDPRFAKSFRISHSGLGLARNHGIDLAEGDFLAFVDSDDYVDPDYCEIPHALACTQESDLVCFGSWWEYPDHQIYNPPTYKLGMTHQEALLNMTPMVWEKLYRREFLQGHKIRFLDLSHDDEVFTPTYLAHKPKISVINRPFYHYTKRDTGICGLSVNRNSVEILKIYSILLDISRHFPEFETAFALKAKSLLQWYIPRWGVCGEDWATKCKDTALSLLRDSSLERVLTCQKRLL